MTDAPQPITHPGTAVSAQRGDSRVAPVAAFTAIGGASIVLGGLVAAITGPLALAQGSWVAAYLVLVGGVAQVAMGQAQIVGGERSRWAWAQFAAWNLGNILVIAATLLHKPFVVDLASMLLVAALVVALGATRSTRWRAWRVQSALTLWLARAYSFVLVVLLVSIPVGMVLSHMQHP